MSWLLDFGKSVENDLGLVAFWGLLIIMILRGIYTFIREKDAPVLYQFFNILGAILFWAACIYPFIADKIIPFEEEGIYICITLDLMAVSSICIGIALKLMPAYLENASWNYRKKKKYWKWMILIGIYLFLFSVAFIYYVFHSDVIH